MSNETFCLKWEHFQLNLGSSFNDLRNEELLSDVTLASDDDDTIEAHKNILAISSPFFKKLLTRHKHPHPLIYIKGMEMKELKSIIDFIYNGEVYVKQDNLQSFLNNAAELKIKGLDNEEGNDAEMNKIKETKKY